MRRPGEGPTGSSPAATLHLMALPLEALEAEALELSVRERARLAHRLLESLDEDVVEDPADVERAWASEIERRLAAYDAGEMEAIPASDVLAEARSPRPTVG